jgi:hypothetical protein
VLRQWLAEDRTVRLPLSGVSMKPTVGTGARIVVERCVPDGIRVADLVVYEDAGALICHRVLWRRGGAILTKGDRLRVPAAWVSATSVIGRVVAIETPARERRLAGARERAWSHAIAARSWLVLAARPVVRALRRVVSA